MSDDFLEDEPSVPATIERDNAIVRRGSNDVEVSHLFFESGLFPSARNVGGVFTIMHYGKEVGLSPVVALNSIAIISGKLAMNGASMLALAMKHGVKATFVEETAEKCIIDFSRPGFPDYRSEFTIQDAEQAELLKKEDGRIKHEGWRKYPNQMLRWRAVSKGLKIVAPDILAGVYTPEEIESIDVVQNCTQTPEQPVQAVAENDTHSGPAPTDAKPEQKQQHRDPTKITEGQLKMLHTVMGERGITPFREEFKYFLLEFKENGMDPSSPSAKDINKKFCYDLISRFREYACQFLTDRKYRDTIIRKFNEMSVEKKSTFLNEVKTLLHDSDFFKLDPEEKDDKRLAGFFSLMLTGIENQEHNRIAKMANDGKGISVEDAIATLNDMGVETKVVTSTSINAEPTESFGF